MLSKKQLRYQEIITHVKAFIQSGIVPTVKDIFNQSFTNPVIIHTIRTDMKNLVKEGKLSVVKINGRFHFNIIKVITTPQIADSPTKSKTCPCCKQALPKIKLKTFCSYCRRPVEGNKTYYKKSCCDECKTELKQWKKTQ